MKHSALLLALLTLSGCTTELTQPGSRIHVLQQGQAANCVQIKYISISQPFGMDVAANIKRRALNEAAAAGGDSIYIYFTWADALRGASLQGEAVRCG